MLRHPSLVLVTALTVLTSLAVVPAGASATTTNDQLQGVSCVSAANCWAVGYNGTDVFAFKTLAEHWNGSTWRIVATPDTSGQPSNVLSGISCVSASSCIAVGYSISPQDTTSALADLWNGVSWSESEPSVENSSGSELSSVYCWSGDDCMAVGSYRNAGGARVPLIERWRVATGEVGWFQEATTDPPGTAVSTLTSVSCFTLDFCAAVGSFENSSNVFVPLAERWNGTIWKLGVAAAPNSMSGYLDAVSCAGTSSCQAVGYSGPNAVGYSALAESWNGTKWSLVTMPSHTGSSGTFPNGIACKKQVSCVAVGYWSSSAGLRVATESWNGTTWHTVSAPDVRGAQDDVLNGVSCSSTSVCAAAGYEGPSNTAAATLGERSNGSIWTITPTPNR
jgi:hypothetical protein